MQIRITLWSLLDKSVSYFEHPKHASRGKFLKDYCHTIALGALCANGSHFIWDTKIKTFNYPSSNRMRIFTYFCLIVIGMEAILQFYESFGERIFQINLLKDEKVNVTM